MEINNKNIRLYASLPQTRALGPYTRFAVWVQGCPRSCSGCMTPAAQSEEGGSLIAIDNLSQQITATPNIEGLTVSGGEPFSQAEALRSLLENIKSRRDLGVIVYTGYYLTELRQLAADKNEIAELLNMIDLLIDGPYIKTLNDGLSLRGSANQGLHLLTERYANVLEKHYCQPRRAVELHLQDREMLLAGIPGREMNGIVKSVKI